MDVGVYLDRWMGYRFTKNQLVTDRQRKVTIDTDGLPPFFLSVWEWQLIPTPPYHAPRARQRSSFLLGDWWEVSWGIRRELSGNGGGPFNYLRGLLVKNKNT